MKTNLPMPAVIGIVVVVVALAGFFVFRGATAEPHTPRPNLYGGPRTDDGAGGTAAAKPETYPGQNGGGAQTPLNSSSH